MPPRNLLRSFIALWMVTGLVLLFGSAVTVREAWAGSQHANPHLVILGGVEAVAALLFMVPRTFRIGAVGLLIVIGVALAVHAALGQFRGDLLLYGVVVLFLLVHGPLTGAQWRAAISRPAT
jgi:hypothetical protein